MEHNSKNKNQNGFSLIELIIVVLVISILVVASIPQVSRNLQLYKLETISSVFADRLLETRLTALKHNRSARLEINQTTKTMKIFTTNNANQSIQKGATVIIPQDIIVDPGSPSNVSFSSLGRNQSNSVNSVVFRTGNNRFCRTVTISAVGKTSSMPC